MWTLGAVCAVLGAMGDAHGWWDERPFLTNLASSFTGILFGVPFALIVVQQLAAHQARMVGRTSIRELARAEAVSLYRAVHDLLLPGVDVEEGLTKAMSALGLLHSKGWKDPATGKPFSPPSPNQIGQTLTVTVSRQELQQAIALWHATFIDDDVAQEAVGMAREHWRHLRDHIAPRLAEFGLPWIDAERVHWFDRHLAQAYDAKPMEQVTHIASWIGGHARYGSDDPNCLVIPMDEFRTVIDPLWDYIDAVYGACSVALDVLVTTRP
jgi:hypothetical protein